MRKALTHRGMYFKNVLKATDSQIERPGSNIIVDPSYFKQSGIISKLANKFKNSNSLFEIKRNVDGFAVHDFEKEALQKYQLVCKFYTQHNHREMLGLLSDDLLHVAS